MGVDMHGRFTADASIPRAEEELLFVGRLVEKKGLRHLLDALPLVRAQRPGCRLKIAGFGPEEAALRAQCHALGLDGSVDFLGAVAQEELPALYRRATVFVASFVEAASGDQEGLGLVMVEAAACGCPVVASDLPAVRDVLEERVTPADAGALAARLLELLSETPQERASRASRLRARLEASFDWQAVALDMPGCCGDWIATPHECRPRYREHLLRGRHLPSRPRGPARANAGPARRVRAGCRRQCIGPRPVRGDARNAHGIRRGAGSQ
jgi:glycosyltransferase involved in cell wall biosynthesis